MTTEEKSRAYDEALERARKQRDEYQKEFDKTDKNSRLASILRAAISAVEMAFPELTESEDEKIRKWILEKVQGYAASGIPCSDEIKMADKAIDYLEEQKYYWKPTETDVALFNKAVTTNKSLTPSERAQLDIVRSKFGCCLATNCNGIVQKEQKPWKVGENAYFDPNTEKWFIKKEQKPADLSEMMVHKEPYIAPVPTPMVADEQKPAEWSEEDKEMFGKVLECIRFAEDHYQLEKEETNGVSVKLWLLDHIIPQPTQEWSEEDIKKIRSEEYTKGFNDAAFVGKIKEWSVEDEDRIRQIERIAQEAGCTQKLQEEIHDWLKSIRKQAKPEWSKEDEMYLSQAIETLEHENYSILADKLKSLKPQTHWKPSEEQMVNLLRAEGRLRIEGESILASKLAGLYKQLKKL